MKMAEQVISLLKTLRVLIVEDGAIIGPLYIDLMEEMGHTVCAIVATETDVVAAAVRYKPDLMIVDVTLSEGSGMLAAEIILRDGFVPHVFVSRIAASVRPARRSAIMMQKPFQSSDSAHAIQRALAAASHG